MLTETFRITNDTGVEATSVLVRFHADRTNITEAELLLDKPAPCVVVSPGVVRIDVAIPPDADAVIRITYDGEPIVIRDVDWHNAAIESVGCKPRLLHRPARMQFSSYGPPPRRRSGIDVSRVRSTYENPPHPLRFHATQNLYRTCPGGVDR